MKRFTSLSILLIVAALPVTSSFTGRSFFHATAEKVTLAGMENLYRISDDLYRSEQPGKKQMAALQEFGIKTVLNLRNARNDRREARETALVLEHVRINTWTMSQEDIVRSLKTIRQSEKPVLVHCLHGSDRTGCVVAAYRMVFGNWTREAAIAEFRLSQFGYHENWFPHLLTLLETLDVPAVRQELGMAGS